MKKIISVFVAFLLLVSMTFQVDAKGMTFFGCKTSDYVKNCKYGYPQSDMGKNILYKYNKKWILKEKETIYWAPLVTERIVIKYNSKGQLKSNKYGKASRYTEKFYSHYVGKDSNKLLIKDTEYKIYNKNGLMRSKFKKYYSATHVDKGDDSYYVSNLAKTNYYKYNKKGKLKSNKYGNATRVMKKYKQKDGKLYNYYIQKGKYNKKGKLIVTSKVFK